MVRHPTANQIAFKPQTGLRERDRGLMVVAMNPVTGKYIMQKNKDINKDSNF